MTEIVVPKLNSNDVSYVLVEWLAADGSPVRAGDPVVVVETSKATEELACGGDGVLRRLLDQGAECRPGQAVGRIEPARAEPAGPRPAGPQAGLVEPAGTVAKPAGPGPAPEDADPVITRPARELIDRYGIAPHQVRALGRPVVRAADLAGLLPRGWSDPSGPTGSPAPADPAVSADPAGPAGLAASVSPAGPAGPAGSAGAAGWPADPQAADLLAALPPQQRAVAQVVTRAHREIPAAFVAVKVYLATARRLVAGHAEAERGFAGLPELIIRTLAGLGTEFPAFFRDGEPGPGPRPVPGTHVGVTMDVGRGLYVPVIRDAGALPLRDIAAALMGFRLKAMRGTFSAAELTGASIVLSVHTEPDVVAAIPIVFPGLACVVTLCASQWEVDLDAAGGLVRREYAQLGMAYDHRLVNGRDAMRFLGAVKHELESVPAGGPDSPPG